MMRPTADNNSQYSPQGGQYNQNQNAYNQQVGQAGGYYGGGGGVAGVANVANNNTPGLALPGFGNSTPPSQQLATPPQSAPPEITGAILNLQKTAAENAGMPFPPLPPPFQVGGSGSGNEESSGGGPPSPTSTGPPPLPPVPGQGFHGSLNR
jgi:hypothetical protein